VVLPSHHAHDENKLCESFTSCLAPRIVDYEFADTPWFRSPSPATRATPADGERRLSQTKRENLLEQRNFAGELSKQNTKTETEREKPTHGALKSLCVHVCSALALFVFVDIDQQFVTNEKGMRDASMLTVRLLRRHLSWERKKLNRNAKSS
jgi:hypothetical protein